MSIDILLSTTEKTKFWSVLKSGKSTIKDSMGLAMYVNYALLKPGGVGGIVCERGILNNGTEGKSWQKTLRKFLLENANIKEILLLPKGIFSHTTFDTACVIMEKGTPTKQVVFHQGYFKDEDKGKGDKKMYVKENILTISLEQIVNKDWSLKYDDYVERKEETYEGIQYKTLGEVCEFTKGKILTSADVEKNIGPYPVIGGGIKPFGFYNAYNLNENSILVSQSGANAGYISKYASKVWASDCFSLSYKNNNFLFYYLKLQQNKFMKRQSEGGLQTGQAQPHVKSGDMEKFKIPFLPADHQARIVEYMDKTFGQDYKRLDKIVSKFKDYDLFKLLLDENYSGFDDLLKMYEDIVWAEEYYQRFTTKYKNMLIQRCFSMVPGKTITLGELVEINKTKLNNKLKDIDYIDLSNVKNNNIIETVKYSFNERPSRAQRQFIVGDILFGTVRPYLKNHCIITQKTYKNTLVASTGFCVLTPTKINGYYLYNYLMLDCFYDKLSKYYSGQAYPAVNLSVFDKIKIPVPSAEDQEKVVKMIDEINKEEGEFSNQVKALKESIIKLYQCVEQLVNTNVSNLNQEADQTLDQQAESDDESEQEQLDDESDEEPVEIEIKRKPYIRIGTKVYVKTEKGRGELYGTWNASTNKFTKVTKEFDV
jgi:type I restriction enzyme S subunit